MVTVKAWRDSALRHWAAVRDTWPVRALTILAAAVRRFVDCQGPSRGAAVAFYAAFSMAPLLVVATGLMVNLLGDQAAYDTMLDTVARLIGPREAKTVADLLANAPYAARMAAVADQASGAAALGPVIALVTTLVAGGVVFVELRAALQAMLGKPQPRGSLWHTVQVRLLSMGMILGLGFLMTLALVVQTGALIALRWLAGNSSVFVPALRAVEVAWSWGVMTVLFALLIRWLPDARLPFRDAVVGAAVAAALFMLGRYGINLYIAKTAVRSTLGAAGSFAALLVWVYWSSQIFLVGAALAVEIGLRRLGPPPTA